MAAPTGTVIKDNILPSLLRESGTATQSYNLLGSGSASTNDIKGRPVFAGGSKPTTFAGYALAAGSPGKGNASDGTDRGFDIAALSAAPGTPGAPTTPAPAAPPAAAGTATPSAGTTAPVGLAAPTAPAGASDSPAAAQVTRWSFRPTAPRPGARVVLDARVPKGAKWTCRWSYDRSTRKGCRAAFRFRHSGLKRITLRITDASGATVKSTKRIRVLRVKRHHR
jgi:hypothetical protein